MVRPLASLVLHLVAGVAVGTDERKPCEGMLGRVLFDAQVALNTVNPDVVAATWLIIQDQFMSHAILSLAVLGIWDKANARHWGAVDAALAKLAAPMRRVPARLPCLFGATWAVCLDRGRRAHRGGACGWPGIEELENAAL